ncbi:hypothetical protein BGW80DRAFT_1417563 [Lactifluus volemus]|nr:hypothetical protein BGW80DRAFT_1417563 [Lactifluus volemus]
MKRFPVRRLYRSTLSIPFPFHPFLFAFQLSLFLSGPGACSMLVVPRWQRGADNQRDRRVTVKYHICRRIVIVIIYLIVRRGPNMFASEFLRLGLHSLGG